MTMLFVLTNFHFFCILFILFYFFPVILLGQITPSLLLIFDQ